MTVDIWPQADLETVLHCPVCRSGESSLEQDAVRDYLHGVPGRWSYFRCGDCNAVYVNPRPTEQSIGRAYVGYATHRAPEAHRPKKRKLGAVLKRAMENIYIREHYTPDGTLIDRLAGEMLANVFRSRRARLDASMRHMPPVPPDGRLLDVGCGNGDFMLRAAAVGWRVFGVDVDPAAVAACRSVGLEVTVGGVGTAGGNGPYDGITMSHVVEHLYDPVSTLLQCRELLKPGGWLWLETPNISGVGYELYRRCWRGLEAPRHLILFDWQSLSLALSKAGFETVERLPNRRVCRLTFRESQQFANVAGYDNAPDPRDLSQMVRKAERIGAKDHRRSEFITLRACRSAND